MLFETSSLLIGLAFKKDYGFVVSVVSSTECKSSAPMGLSSIQNNSHPSRLLIWPLVD